jgi:glycosyltransferase involved in cell wall biosynthesis
MQILTPEISVIICTHNPRPDYLQRVLDALQAQTLSKERWELLLVDNGSQEPLVSAWDLSWHPRARHIREEELGVTLARMRGIGESTAELLVFVDDDTVLAPNYLSVGWEIAQSHPFLGAWSGQCHPEFEIPPPRWMARFGVWLTVRRFSGERWSNLGIKGEDVPWGAGLWVRRKAALEYNARVGEDLKRKKLGRIGRELMACEDLDLAQTACDIGLSAGIFSTLELTHLIRKNRLTEDYLLGVIEGHTYSMTMLEASRGMVPSIPRKGNLRRALGKLRRWLTMSRLERLSVEAIIRGRQRAVDELAEG